MKNRECTTKTVTRIFSGDKIIESKLLNLVGVQVVRSVAARLLYRVRWIPVDELVKSEIDELRTEGILIWPKFLPDAEFRALEDEFSFLVRQAEKKVKIYNHGPNTVEVASINQFAETLAPNTYKFLTDHRLRSILVAAEKRPLESLWRFGEIELLTLGPDNNEEDPQTQLHSDIWFNSHKAWLYLTDVEMEDGPLVYVKRSHRLNPVQLCYVYDEGCRRNRCSDPSRRITPEELNRQGMRETIVTCPKNTLVIANTCGYHRRLRGRPGRKRNALHLFLRGNPFTAYAVRARLSRYPQLYNMLTGIKSGLFRHIREDVAGPTDQPH